jgi:hypothetical protein
MFDSIDEHTGVRTHSFSHHLLTTAMGLYKGIDTVVDPWFEDPPSEDRRTPLRA